MKELNGFWILDKVGTVLFQYETFIQGSEDYTALFSNVIVAIQAFVQNLGEDKVKQMELGKSKVFISRDDETELILVIKTDKNAKAKKFNKLLEKVQTFLIQTYIEKVFTKKELIEYIKTSFSNDFSELFKDQKVERLSDFMRGV